MLNKQEILIEPHVMSCPAEDSLAPIVGRRALSPADQIPLIQAIFVKSRVQNKNLTEAVLEFR